MKLTLILSSMFLACSIHAQTPAQLSPSNAALQKQVTALQAQVNQILKTQQSLQAQITTLHLSPVQYLAPFVTVDYDVENGVAAPNITFHGANMHIVNGAGSTGSVNGLGNLIIGYDETPATLVSGDRGGSHNLVLGSQNKFTSAASSGIIGGTANLIAGANDIILSGSGNSLSGGSDIILTGFNNQIFVGGGADVILSGENNRIDARPSVTSEAVIISGRGNGIFTKGSDGVVVGGDSNTVQFMSSVVVGGIGNNEGGYESVLLGGDNITHEPLIGTGAQSVSAANLPGN
jgi:hypothetical protein